MKIGSLILQLLSYVAAIICVVKGRYELALLFVIYGELQYMQITKE